MSIPSIQLPDLEWTFLLRCRGLRWCQRFLVADDQVMQQHEACEAAQATCGNSWMCLFYFVLD
jgi:hypothetical protein